MVPDTSEGRPGPLVELRDIRVSFGGVHAVDGVTVDLHAGEVVALVGGNGAGKSTLMRVLSGAHPANSGQILINGQPVSITNPRDARALGIETIYQTLALADNIDAAANVFLGREILTRTGALDDSAMASATREVMRRLNPRFTNLKTPVGWLSGGQRQAVAIARAVHFNARVLIMDEPTAALGPAETAQVHELVAQLKSEGLGHLPDQPRHPRRVRSRRPHRRDAHGWARRHRQQARRHQGRGAGDDHPRQEARARCPIASWPSSTTDSATSFTALPTFRSPGQFRDFERSEGSDRRGDPRPARRVAATGRPDAVAPSRAMPSSTSPGESGAVMLDPADQLARVGVDVAAERPLAAAAAPRRRDRDRRRHRLAAGR